MNRSYSKIRHIQQSNIILESRLIKEDIELGDENEIQSRLDSLYDENRDLFNKYEKYKERLLQDKMRKDPKFNLVIAKTNEKYDSILAAVKWPFEYNGKRLKNDRLSIFIGSLRKYPLGLDTPNIREISKKIISDKLFKNSSYPQVD